MIRRNIALCASFAALTMLLSAMWLRSLWWKEEIVWIFAPDRYIHVESDRGNLSSSFFDLRGQVRTPSGDPRTFIVRRRWLSTSDRYQGFGGYVSRDSAFIASPYWFLVLTAATLGMLTAPLRPSWRFSLRTLLITTTLLAIALGLAMSLAT
ncbi:MAG: hypothetical protein AB7G28_20085 [Pirellulales bacterium]